MKSIGHINRIPLILFIAITLFAGIGQMTDMIIPASVHAENDNHGILGQPAPELDITDWIDGEGQPMDPIRLKELKGKVIYLYFFQNW